MKGQKKMSPFLQHSACNLNIVGVFDIVKQELFTTKSRSKTCLLVTLKMNSNLEHLRCYKAMLCMHYLLLQMVSHSILHNLLYV